MADPVDEANSMIAQQEESALAAIYAKAAAIPKGYAGDCNNCGETSKRIVDGMCAPCRDKLSFASRYRK
jgi:hypothetical protein